MACVKGESICENCETKFSWLRHDSQPPARFCSRKCTNKDFGKKGNEKKLFWPVASEIEKKEKIKIYFYEKVIKKKGCWGWNGYVDKNGYTQIHAGKTLVKGHRVSYEIHKGEIPEGKLVCHSCDNPTCTNPDHLWLGTNIQNSQDAQLKKRMSFGENRWNSKLKKENINEIRKLISLGVSVAHLSRLFEVSYMTIKNVKIGKTWKHVT